MASSILLLPLLLASAAASAAVDPSWQRVPIRSAAFAAAGRLGGEGCQVVRALGASRANPDFLLLGADVGGVHRSLSGGAEWHPAMVGWRSRGATAFAFDDADALHVLGVGGNSGSFQGDNGVHVSFDGAASWSFVLPIADAEGCLDGSAIAFDPTSASGGGGAQVAFFSSEAGLWRSADGGRTWTVINAFLLGACLAVDSAGNLFAASNDYRSYGVYACGARYDGSSGNCSRTRAEYTTGLDLARDGSDAVFISNWAGVMVSADHVASFRLLGGVGLPAPGTAPMHHVSVSPANASHIMVWWAIGPSYNTTFAVSHDGGATFATSTFDNTDAFMPYNGRDGKPVWHAKNSSVAWSAGGDWPTRSDDGGRTLRWSGAGYNVVMTGGSFAFSAHAPDVLFLAFQDYAGALTADRGASWTSVVGPNGISGETWGGFDYDGYALNATTLWAGNAPSWTGPRTLRVSFDAGATWRTATAAGGAPVVFAGAEASAGDPLDPLVGFASNWRTGDGGRTWAAMSGCAGVFSAAADSGALLGVSAGGAAVVRSADHGLTWQTLFSSPASGAVKDLAFDWRANVMYVVADGALFACSAAAAWACAPLASRLPSDQAGGMQVRSCAVDPVEPSVVYASAARDLFSANNAVVRSTDAGGSFASLVLDAPLSPEPGAPLQGPHEVGFVRVHPVTRELWAAGECFGVWKAPPPSA